MKTKEPLIIIVPLIVCIIAAAIAYKSSVSVRNVKTSSEEGIHSLKSEVAKLAGELKSINEMLAKQSKKIVLQSADDGPGQTKDWLSLLDNDLQKIEKTLSKTGLDLLATNDVDPVLLKEMFAEFSEKKELETYQEKLRAYNTELHKSDKDKYDVEIAQLYESARFKRRGRGENKNRDEAFKKMLEKYPDSNSTGMLIAERAIGAGFKGSIEDSEKYYKQLTENDNFENIVTDWGAEAVPMIQFQLANRYIKDGRIDDARSLLNELEAREGESYVLTPSPGHRRPTWQKTSTVVDGLMKRMNE